MTLKYSEEPADEWIPYSTLVAESTRKLAGKPRGPRVFAGGERTIAECFVLQEEDPAT